MDNRRRASLPNPPFNNVGWLDPRPQSLDLNYIAGYNDLLLFFLFERTKQLTPLTTKGTCYFADDDCFY